ncbi:MAG TPA: T9SS type A sorting domain-containing protein, partial [Saprospiraceae bacterium]|nr:T9SS type A sorting domain-containing protein [Saprospiraceae bacterium]
TRALGSATKLAAVNNWVRGNGVLANNIDPVPFEPGTVLINPLAASKTPDFRPITTSPASSGANFTDNPVLVNLITASEEIEKALESAVYPNPISNGDLHFGHEVVSYGIFDLSGKLVGHGFDTDRADINGLIPGLYLIKFEGRMQKFIVQ